MKEQPQDRPLRALMKANLAMALACACLPGCTGVIAAQTQTPAQAPTQTPSQAPASSPPPLELNTPTVPVAPASTPQPASAVLDTPAAQAPGDKSALSSPVAPDHMAPYIRVGSAVAMKLTDQVSSGAQRNGDTVHGVLTAPVTLSNGVALPAGTNVDATVVSAARAGTVGSAGVLSLQLTRVGGHAVVTDVVDFNGQEGHKDVADSAPAKGTEAVVKPGTLLNFHVLETGKATGLAPGANATSTPPAKKP